jgi:hypothetical protein
MHAMSRIRIQAGDGYGLMEFLDLAPQNGWIHPGTAKAYRAAVAQVLDVVCDGGDPGEVDIQTLNIGSALQKFEAARGEDYTDGSLASYRTRFKRSVEMYREYLHNPDALQPVEREQPKIRGGYLGSEGVAELAHKARAGYTVRPPADDETIEYPFPLSDGGTAWLRLPRHLLPQDVDRLTAFLKSIAISPSGQARLPLDVVPPQPE